jgi:hypothetical protein
VIIDVAVVAVVVVVVVVVVVATAFSNIRLPIHSKSNESSRMIDLSFCLLIFRLHLRQSTVI